MNEVNDKETVEYRLTFINNLDKVINILKKVLTKINNDQDITKTEKIIKNTTIKNNIFKPITVIRQKYFLDILKVSTKDKKTIYYAIQNVLNDSDKVKYLEGSEIKQLSDIQKFLNKDNIIKIIEIQEIIQNINNNLINLRKAIDIYHKQMPYTINQDIIKKIFKKKPNPEEKKQIEILLVNILLSKDDLDNYDISQGLNTNMKTKRNIINNLEIYYKSLKVLLDMNISNISFNQKISNITKGIELLLNVENINEIQTEKTDTLADLNKKKDIIEHQLSELNNKKKEELGKYQESSSTQPGLTLQEQLDYEREALLVSNAEIIRFKSQIVELETHNAKQKRLYLNSLEDIKLNSTEKTRYENEIFSLDLKIKEYEEQIQILNTRIEHSELQIKLLTERIRQLNILEKDHVKLKEQQKLLIFAIKHFQYKLSKHATTTEAIEQIKLENAIIFDALVYNRTSDELDDLIRAINEEEKGIIEEETPYTLSGMIGGLFSKGGFPIIIPPSVTDESILRDIDTHRGALSEDDVKQLDKIINERRIKINQEKSTSSAKAPQRIEFRENLNKIINKITNVPETKPELVDALEFDDNRDNLDINSPNNMYDEFDINSPNEILDDINAIDGYSVFKSIFANPEEKLLLLRHFAVNTVILGGAVGSLLLFAMIFEYSIYVASAMVNKINFPNTPTSELVDIISETTGKPKDFIINAVREVNESGITIIVPTAPTPSDPVFSISDIFGWIGKQAGKLLGYLLTMLIAFSKWLIEQGFKILKNIAYGIASGGIKSIIYLAAIFITFVAVTAKSTITNNNIIP